MPDRIEDPWYDADNQVRRVRSAGEIMWRGELVFISEALVGELVGIAELETGDHVVRFCNRDIGGSTASPNLSGIIPVQNVDHQTG